MDSDEPCRREVDKVVQHVRIGYTIYCSIDGDAEEEDARKVAEAGRDSWNHFAAGESLHKKDEGHDGEDIMMGRERCEPVHSQVVHPDNKNWEVDGKYPEH